MAEPLLFYYQKNSHTSTPQYCSIQSIRDIPRKSVIFTIFPVFTLFPCIREISSIRNIPKYVMIFLKIVNLGIIKNIGILFQGQKK